MYTGLFKPLRGTIGVIENYKSKNEIIVVLESVVDYPENRLLVDANDLMVIYRDIPNDDNRGEVVKRAWPSKLFRP